MAKTPRERRPLSERVARQPAMAYDEDVRDTSNMNEIRARVSLQSENFNELRTFIKEVQTENRNAISTLANETKLQLGNITSEFKAGFNELRTSIVDVARSQTSKSSETWKLLLSVTLPVIGAVCTLAWTFLNLRISPIEDKLLLTSTNLVSMTSMMKEMDAKFEPKAELAKDAATMVDRIKRAEDATNKLDQKVDSNAAERRVTVATKQELSAAIDTAAVRSAHNREAIEQHERRILKMEESVVPRAEHDRRWADTIKQMDELKSKFEQLYPAATLLKDLSERLHNLETINGRSR